MFAAHGPFHASNTPPLQPNARQEIQMSNNETHNWPDLAIGLYERLTGQKAEIIYQFEDMTVEVPSGTADESRNAPWRLNGTLRIRTREHDGS